MQSFPLTSAADYWDSIKTYPVIPFHNPLDSLLNGGMYKGLIHGIGTTKDVMTPLFHQIILNYHTTIPRENWQPLMLIEGTNRFNPYKLSKMAVANRIPPTLLLDNIQIARSFQWYQMLELVEERTPAWIEGNPAEIPGMILVVGITSDFEETVSSGTDDFTPLNERGEHHINLKPFQDLKRALGKFSAVLRHSPYIVFLTPLHSKSGYKLAGGNFFRHYCNIITRINPLERSCMYHLDQHPFLPTKSIRVWNKKTRPLSFKERKTKILDYFM